MERRLSFPDFPRWQLALSNGPCPSCACKAPSRNRLIALADRILAAWRGYTDEKAFLFAENGRRAPTTPSPPLPANGGSFWSWIWSCGTTSPRRSFPWACSIPTRSCTILKKENIGLIEVMGLAVLPSRLKTELAGLEQAIVKRSGHPHRCHPGKTRRLGGWSETAVRIHPPATTRKILLRGNRQGLLPGPGGCRCLQTYPRGARQPSCAS